MGSIALPAPNAGARNSFASNGWNMFSVCLMESVSKMGSVIVSPL